MPEEIKGEVCVGHESGVVPGIQRKPAEDLPLVPEARNLFEDFSPLDEDEQYRRQLSEYRPG